MDISAAEILEMLRSRLLTLREFEAEYIGKPKSDDYQTTLLLMGELAALVAKAKAIIEAREK